jgi:hypothetical protein
MRRPGIRLILSVPLIVVPLAARVQAQKGAPLKKVQKQKVRTFSEAEKKSIFLATALAEKRAKDEAKRRYPIPDPTNSGYSQDFAGKQIMRQSDLANQLQDKYHKQINKKFGITDKQRNAIVGEGLSKNWPFPVSR